MKPNDTPTQGTEKRPSQGIALNHLAIGYAARHGSARIVAQGLDAEALPGQLTCLVGGNGVGKSTLLRTVAALQKPLGGSVSIDGQRTDVLSDAQRAQQVAVVLSATPHLPHTTIGRLVAMGRAPYTGFWGRLSDTDQAACAEALQQVGIEHLRHRLLDEVSDGERQKATIARALAQLTPAIVLDEPTAFLDYPSKAAVMALLRRLATEGQRTVLLSTHDLGLALQLAHRLWVMTEEGLVQGPPTQLAADGTLKRFIDSDLLSLDAASLTIRMKGVL